MRASILVLGPMLVVAVLRAEAQACDCAALAHKEALAASDVAGVGTVVALELPGERPAWPARDRAAARPACDWGPPTDRGSGCIAGAVIDGAAAIDLGVVEIIDDERIVPPRAAQTATFQGGCVRTCWLVPGPMRLRLGSLERTVERTIMIEAGRTTDVSVDLDGITGALVGPGRALIAIEEPWKGSCAGDRVWVDFDSNEATCGYGGFVAGLGQRFAVYGTRDDGGALRVGRCSGTHQLGDGSQADVTRPPIARDPACTSHAAGQVRGGCGRCDAGGAPSIGAIALFLLVAAGLRGRRHASQRRRG